MTDPTHDQVLRTLDSVSLRAPLTELLPRWPLCARLPSLPLSLPRGRFSTPAAFAANAARLARIGRRSTSSRSPLATSPPCGPHSARTSMLLPVQ